MARTRSTTDEALLEVARAVFLEDGIAASTKKIASQAGVSEGVLFQRFGSKQTLFFQSMRLPQPDLTAVLAASEKSKDVARGLKLLATAALEYYRSVMPMVMLLLSHPARQDALKRHGSQAHTLLVNAFDINASFEGFFGQRVAAGELAKRDYTSLATMLLATLLTRALHEQIGLDNADTADKWLRKIVRALLT